MHLVTKSLRLDSIFIRSNFTMFNLFVNGIDVLVRKTSRREILYQTDWSKRRTLRKLSRSDKKVWIWWQIWVVSKKGFTGHGNGFTTPKVGPTFYERKNKSLVKTHIFQYFRLTMTLSYPNLGLPNSDFKSILNRTVTNSFKPSI